MTKCSRSLTLLLDMKQYFLSALLLAAANMGAVAEILRMKEESFL